LAAVLLIRRGAILAELLGREEFNRLTAGLTGYDSDSADVLRKEIAIAQSRGDTGAEAAARRDLARVTKTGATPMATNPPTTMSLDPAGSLSQFAGFAPEVQAAILGTDQERSTAVKQANTALEQYGQSQAAGIRAGAENEIAGDEIRRHIMQALGMDIDNPDSVLNFELRKNAEARQRREALDSQITDLESINFFQNPFAFLAAQPKLQALTAQYNNAARIENSSNEEIAKRQAIEGKLIQDTPMKNAALVRQKAEADANAAVQMAQARASELTAQNASGHAKALMDAWTVGHNVFQAVLEMERLKDLNAERAANRAERAENAKDRAVLRQLQIDQIKDKEAERKRDQALALGINASLKMIGGGNTVDPESLKNMDPKERKTLLGVLARGNYGNTYAESIPLINTYGNLAEASKSNPGMATAIRNVITRVQQEALNIRRQASQAGTPINEKDAIPLAFEKVYKDDSSFAVPGVPKDGMSPANPYAIDFDAAAAAAKLDPKGSVVNAVLAAAKDRSRGATLNVGYNPKLLLQEVESRVITGEVPPKVAAEQLARFMAVQATSSYIGNGLKYLGLPQPTDWSVSASAVGKTNVDMMNPTQLENYFTSRIAAEKASSRPGLNNPFVPFR
jgi:hypothetical protein